MQSTDVNNKLYVADIENMALQAQIWGIFNGETLCYGHWQRGVRMALACKGTVQLCKGCYITLYPKSLASIRQYQGVTGKFFNQDYRVIQLSPATSTAVMG